VVLTVDDTHLGPSEAAWDSVVSRTPLRALDPPHVRRVVVVSPHPDDEVFGAGGLIEWALRERVLVEVVAVTDGEASHPSSRSQVVSKLADLRASESREALRRLGWNDPVITPLHLPDGKVSEHLEELDVALENILLPDDLCVAPWRRDGHPDHDSVGEVALRASQRVGACALGYLIWTWHWADPEGDDVPWSQCRRLSLSRRACARKRWSTLAFASQVSPIGPSVADAAIVPPAILRRFWRPYELYVDEACAS
jgi:LmbE family N-acetylglucosaminyl deacetylase